MGKEQWRRSHREGAMGNRVMNRRHLEGDTQKELCSSSHGMEAKRKESGKGSHREGARGNDLGKEVI